MTAVPTLTLFNNTGGVGTTALVYHLAWMLSDLGYRVLACDLDPQARLTAAFLDEDRLERLWSEEGGASASGSTIMHCLHPLTEVGDIALPTLASITPTLGLIPGDPALAGFEDALSAAWPNASGSGNPYRPFRIVTAFSTVMQDGAGQMGAEIVLADVGPNLGAINRSALIATDALIVPLGADLFSLQGLRNLGPTLRGWRTDWRHRRENWKRPAFSLPDGSMRPIGYVVRQHGVRLNRPIRAYDKWANRLPAEYARHLLGDATGPYPRTPAQDERHALATVKPYRSLVPMAQEARKPIFHLTTADGAIGSHAAAATAARRDFRDLARKIAARIPLAPRG